MSLILNSGIRDKSGACSYFVTCGAGLLRGCFALPNGANELPLIYQRGGDILTLVDPGDILTLV